MTKPIPTLFADTDAHTNLPVWNWIYFHRAAEDLAQTHGGTDIIRCHSEMPGPGVHLCNFAGQEAWAFVWKPEGNRPNKGLVVLGTDPDGLSDAAKKFGIRPEHM